MQAMLLAAGLGTRLRPYTLFRPKPLFPILNRPLLGILIDMLGKAGCGKIVVNGHHLADLVEQAVTGMDNVSYQFEPEILGTGGSLREALPQFTDNAILVMNGDIFHNIDIAELYKHHVSAGNRVTMAMHDCGRFNSVRVHEDHIQSFYADREDGENDVLAFTGIHVVDASIIKRIPAGRFFHIIDLYEDLIKQGEMIGSYRVDGMAWQDIGTVDDYLALHGKLLTGDIQENFIGPVSPGSWRISHEARVPDNVVLKGWGCIGNAEIGSGAHLRNCVVWDDTVVPDGAHLEDMIVTSK